MAILHVKTPNGTQKDVDIDKIFTTDGGTINGNCTIKNECPGLSMTCMNDTRGVAPTTALDTWGPIFLDKTGKYLAGLQFRRGIDKSESLKLVLFDNITENPSYESLSINVDGNGNFYITAPTPANGDNTTKIATTAFIYNNYLPLSGASPLTGNLLSSKTDFNIVKTTNTGSLQLKGGIDSVSGASLFLYGSSSTNLGQFSIRASQSSNNYKDLVGTVNGSLTWVGKEVERLNSKGSNYVRYENGLQLCWGIEHGNDTGSYKTITFPVPFNNDVSDIVITMSAGSVTSSASNHISFQITEIVNTSFAFLTSIASSWSNGVSRWIAIGFWK